ncbi:MAG: hypothetical protein QXK37_04875 [Candidatus Woesearchaeota archaeon]
MRYKNNKGKTRYLGQKRYFVECLNTKRVGFLWAFAIMLVFLAWPSLAVQNNPALASNDVKQEVISSDESTNIENTEEDVKDTTEKEIPESIKEEMAGKPIAECIAKLSERYPKVSPIRIKLFCGEAARTIAQIKSEYGKPGLAVAGDRFRACVAFVNANNIDAKPENFCQKAVENEEACLNFLKQKGVPDAVIKCKQISNARVERVSERLTERLRERAQIAQEIRDTIPQWKIKHMEEMAEKNEKIKEMLKNLSEDKATVFMHLSVAEQKRIAEQGNPEILDRYTLRKVSKEELFKKRIVAANIRENARMEFNKAKERYENANTLYKAKMQEFASLRQRVRACNASNSTECQKMNQEAVERAKEWLSNYIDMVISHLEKVRSRANESEFLTEDEAATITADIDKAIAELKKIKGEISSATTKEEIKDAASKVREFWQKANYQTKINILKIYGARVGEIVKRSEHLENRLDCVIASMKEQGINTSEIEPLKEDFSEKIQEAKDHLSTAKSYFKEAIEFRMQIVNASSEDIQKLKELHTQAHSEIKKAHESLKEAHRILMEITKKIRSNGGKITACKKMGEGLGADEELVVEEIEDSEEELEQENSE